MKKYIIPQARTIKMESSEHLLQSSYVDIGGDKTDKFGSNRRGNIFDDGKDENDKMW